MERVVIELDEAPHKSSKLGFSHKTFEKSCRITKVDENEWVPRRTTLSAEHIGWKIVKVNSENIKSRSEMKKARENLKEYDPVTFTLEREVKTNFDLFLANSIQDSKNVMFKIIFS